MNYRLLADSGSTKTDWVVCLDGNPVKRISTQGINPYMLDESSIEKIIREELKFHISDFDIDEIEFYGAGCRETQCEKIFKVLQNVLNVSHITAGTDMLGAARALADEDEGIVCILGTGSNSCFYDGHSIVKNVSPLGYVLGDEGSGAVLGRRLLGDVLKNQMSEPLVSAFFEEYPVTVDDIIQRVYREPFPNRYLASFCPFLSKHKSEPEVKALLLDEFRRFFVRNVANYHRNELPVHFVGSIAFYFEDVLREAAVSCGFSVGNIKKCPLDWNEEDRGKGLYRQRTARL